MNAILYARFSPRPNAAECESADKQLERCRSWCSAMGHTVAADAEFKDEGASGATTDERPGLAAALERVKRERGILVVAAIDRLGRNIRDLLDISEAITDAGASWASLAQSIDTTTPQGRFMLVVFGGMAQMEREITAERTKIGMQRLQKQGWKVSCHAKTGRRPLPPEQQPTPEQRETRGIPPKALRTEPAQDELEAIAVAASLRAQNYSWRQIASELAARGFSYRGGRWTHVTIFRVLRACPHDLRTQATASGTADQAG